MALKSRVGPKSNNIDHKIKKNSHEITSFFFRWAFRHFGSFPVRPKKKQTRWFRFLPTQKSSSHSWLKFDPSMINGRFENPNLGITRRKVSPECHLNLHTYNLLFFCLESIARADLLLQHKAGTGLLERKGIKFASSTRQGIEEIWLVDTLTWNLHHLRQDGGN